MAHFAVLCPAASGHVNPMSTLLMELLDRGHQITWIGEPDGVAMARQRGLHAVTIGEHSFPLGSVPRRMAELGERTGFNAMRFTLDWFREATEVLLEEATAAIRQCQATALIADEAVFAGRTVAELLDMRWITVSGAMSFHPDPDHPLFDWKYRDSWWGRVRNRLGISLAGWMTRSLTQVIARARRRHGLRAYDWLRENASRLATIAQIPAEFDYPRRNKPPWFHYVGGLHDLRARPQVEFPFDRLDDNRRLVYASMGTVQNRLLPVFRAIATACAELPVQLVISLGGGAKPDDLGDLAGDPIVVAFAPQLELLRRARLVITHAGMNTTIESLAAAVPMVAIPITNDQPAVAARIAWSGCGEVIPLRRATPQRIARTVDRVLHDEQYRRQSRRLADANRKAGGVKAAANIIERAVT